MHVADDIMDDLLLESMGEAGLEGSGMPPASCDCGQCVWCDPDFECSHIEVSELQKVLALDLDEHSNLISSKGGVHESSPHAVMTVIA